MNERNEITQDNWASSVANSDTSIDHFEGDTAGSSASEIRGQTHQVTSDIDKVPPFAGFWMRFWAYLADLIIIGSINRIIVHPIFTALDVSENGWFSAENLSTAIIFYLYFTLMTKYAGQTLGKMIFGLKVISLKEEKLSWGTVLFREFIGRFISKTIIIGYIIVGWLPKKQGLHDIFADTSVILDKR
ncbi:RDD family protein [Bacillus sp. V5-8f]|uniref:RDD family protein n=1 Tax=Bacillus sp. V5-8f TaxID=2053044 RepID=UPI000C772F1E|nr:RDD family protein [Bacillus sp. V5-8f]PLT32276.1 hypothetical protein CUU64_19425 [Bacillus sp. V5-8f]